MTYSQFGQDDEIVKFFNGKTSGWFIDVGAHSDGSDTILLEKMGWSGVCVEPCDDLFEQLKNNRSCLCENICLGDKNGEVDFCWNTGYTSALSGVVEYYDQKHIKRIISEQNSMGGERKIVKKTIKTLTTLLESINFPNHIELLKMDVEGGEYPIIQGINFSKYSFDLITIEANYQNEYEKCKIILNKNGYQEFKNVGIDVFFKKIVK
jgi:FkbM family methyltransferase